MDSSAWYIKGPVSKILIAESSISVLLIFTCAGWRGGGVAGAECGAMPKEATNELFW